MNYYPFHIGDYKAHTAYLTPMQDIAYRRLLDLYYLQERPLPGDAAACARQIGMREYLDDVQLVLEDYFHLEDGQYRNARCDRVLKDWTDKQEKSRRAGEASARARSKRSQSPDPGLSTGQELSTGNDGHEQALNGRSTDVERPLSERATDAEQVLNQTGTPVEHPLNERSASVEQAFNTRSTGVEHPFNGRSTNQEPITNNQRLNPPLSPLGRGEAPRGSSDPEQKPPGSPPQSAQRSPRRRSSAPEDWAGVHVPRPDDVPEPLWRDFCTLRKAKAAPITEAALTGIRRGAETVGAGMAEALAFMAERGHQGFFPDAWVRARGGNVPAPVRRRLATIEDFSAVDYGEGGPL
nr:MAG TPA: Protein of unknown function (DUF1376) [Caudoviricetes sp.]